VGGWRRSLRSWTARMPKSKRAQTVTLSKTQKKGRDRKSSIIDEVRGCCDTYRTVYAFDADNMRNAALKEVRAKLSGSRIFFGRTKLLTAALGRSPSEEYRDGICQVAKALAGGEAGLIFTNEAHDTVERVLNETQVPEFARAGNEASQDHHLEEGPLHNFPHNMEPYLRKLGLPTKLDRGVVTLLAPYTVCQKGMPLESDQAKLLQLLGIKMAVFKLSLRCRWCGDGDYEEY
jgi:mRNA turnover protein 4